METNKVVDRGGVVEDRVGKRETERYLPRTIDFLPEFFEALKSQLKEDEERWGDTWLHRPREGQEERIREDFRDYFDKYEHAGKDINWLAVAGNALIAWIREEHPELSEEW